MTHRVVFDTSAETDLLEIGGWISGHASPEVAERYLARLLAYCRRLDVFPQRGTRRDDLYPGLRTIGFERRVVIAFLVREETVSVVRVLYGGQKIEAAFGHGDED